MPSPLPYLPNYKNVGKLFESINSAKRPEVLTHSFLYDTLGLKSNGDRPLIAMLKNLGFLESSGKPTSEYDNLKGGEKVARRAIARGIKTAYSPLFAANEKANELSSTELKGLVAQVAGSDANTTNKIVGTLNALLKVADFSEDASSTKNVVDKEKENKEQKTNGDGGHEDNQNILQFSGMSHQFHYNIQVHLPANGTEQTYMDIFNALRKVFK